VLLQTATLQQHSNPNTREGILAGRWSGMGVEAGASEAVNCQTAAGVLEEL